MPASITAKVWVLAWVSTPMTYAKEFATIVMVTLILSLWVDVTTGVDPGKSLRGRPVISHGHHKWSDKLLIKPSQWTGSAPVPTGPDRSWARHSKPIAEGQTLHESQPNRAPTPTLPANPRSATQRLTDASKSVKKRHLPSALARPVGLLTYGLAPAAKSLRSISSSIHPTATSTSTIGSNSAAVAEVL